MSSDSKHLIHPPGLGVTPAPVEHSMELAKADDTTAGQVEVTKEPRIFPRRRPDITDAEAGRREAMRAHLPPSSENSV